MSDIKPWKTLESAMALENERIKIRKDICQQPDGVIIQDYFVREEKEVVIVFCTTKTGDVVLVRQYRHGSQEITLELPGGYVERHDINVAEAARRELLEETGHSSQQLDEIATFSMNPAQSTAKIHVFYAPDADKIASPKYIQGEVTEALHLSPKDVLEKIENGEIVSTPNIAAMYRGLTAIGYLKHE